MSDEASGDKPVSEPSAQTGPEEDGIGRARLLAALRAKPSRGQLVAAVLCALLGFAVAVQVRANQDEGLSGLRQTDLVRILDDVTERSNRLQTEARDLEDTRARVTNGSTGSRAALDIPGGVLDVLRQDDAQGVVTQKDRVTISSLRAAPSPRYARPAND